jgi:putative PIG3 family NAD(P)H quinone oxidoreductase
MLMRAIEISHPGPPDVLRLVHRPDPFPGAGEVLIDVQAAGVNRPDLMQREGDYPPPKGVTDIPGLEVSGRIVAVGHEDADGPPRSASGRVWSLGDEVCALVSGGGYAERCAVSGLQCLPIPAGMSLVTAAAIPETFFTVWANVFERGRLGEGEWLLVHGGSSGIGTTAIQLARARGAHVIITAGSDDKCQACVAIGANHAINYRAEDFVSRVKALTGGRGVDVILDIVGGAYTPKNLECLARDGRLIQIGLLGGADTAISLLPILLKRLTISGSTLRARTPAEKGVIAAALEQDIWPYLASGQIRPIIDRTFPFAEAAEAHRVLESGGVVGKLVLTP